MMLAKYVVYFIPDIDECPLSPCDTNSECTNTLGNFTCTCNAGYGGDGKNCAGKAICDLYVKSRTKEPTLC